jgi:uroporphyrinogen decarboxylase
VASISTIEISGFLPIQTVYLIVLFLVMNYFSEIPVIFSGANTRRRADLLGRGRRCFAGIDQQDLLPSGDEKAIREEMTRRTRILGDGGGYLMAPAHVIQADVSPQTVEIMCEAVLNG